MGEYLISNSIGLCSMPGFPKCHYIETQSLFDCCVISTYPENSIPFIETNQQKIILLMTVQDFSVKIGRAHV